MNGFNEVVTELQKKLKFDEKWIWRSHVSTGIYECNKCRCVSSTLCGFCSLPRLLIFQALRAIGGKEDKEAIATVAKIIPERTKSTWLGLSWALPSRNRRSCCLLKGRRRSRMATADSWQSRVEHPTWVEGWSSGRIFDYNCRYTFEFSNCFTQLS